MKHLHEIPYEKFKMFLDSLSEEYDTWTLDLQNNKNDKEFYENGYYTMILMDGDKMIGLFDAVVDFSNLRGHPNFKSNRKYLNIDFIEEGTNVVIVYSYVIHKDYQQKGLAKKTLDQYMKYIHSTLYTDLQLNLYESLKFIIHSARTNENNIASRKLLRSLGYQATWKDTEKSNPQIIYMKLIDVKSNNIEEHVQMMMMGLTDFDMDLKKQETKLNIQFIITGWHFNQESLIDGLHELKNENDNINVFWSCHREPTQEIKEKFEWKLFHNGGEECGAYDQAINHLNLDDDTICFFMHDDIIIKDWNFIPKCLDILNTHKIIGNCRDYSDNFNPFKITEIGISEEFDGKMFKDYVKLENQHLFDEVLPIYKVRPSFICMKYKDVVSIGGFEPREEALIPPLTEKDEWCEKDEPHYRGTKGLGSYGNLFPALVCYKMNKVLGSNSIAYLSDRYLDSDYIYEMGRGKIDPNNPIT